MSSPKAFLLYVKENEPIVRFLDQVLADYGIDVVTNYKNIDGGSNCKSTGSISISRRDRNPKRRGFLSLHEYHKTLGIYCIQGCT